MVVDKVVSCRFLFYLLLSCYSFFDDVVLFLFQCEEV